MPVFYFQIFNFAQIKSLKEVDSLKDVTVRFGSVLFEMSRVRLHNSPTKHENPALLSVEFLP